MTDVRKFRIRTILLTDWCLSIMSVVFKFPTRLFVRKRNTIGYRVKITMPISLYDNRSNRRQNMIEMWQLSCFDISENVNANDRS